MLLAVLSLNGAAAAPPETVMVTLRPRAGAAEELAHVIAKHWATVHALKLVEDTPHTTLRATEAGGKTYFIEIFTWKSADIPDHAPPEVQAIWESMNRLVEPSDGHPGLEFTPVSVVTGTP
jgi:hypothetical protein